MAHSVIRALGWRKMVLLLAFVAAGLLVSTTILVPFASEMWTQATLMLTVERRIGAEIRAPYVTLGKTDREVITFSAVRPGGPVANAGVANVDFVVEDVSIGDLSRRLNATKGTRVSVEVAPGGNGTELDQRPRRKVSIVLP